MPSCDWRPQDSAGSRHRLCCGGHVVEVVTRCGRGAEASLEGTALWAVVLYIAWVVIFRVTLSRDLGEDLVVAALPAGLFGSLWGRFSRSWPIAGGLRRRCYD